MSKKKKNKQRKQPHMKTAFRLYTDGGCAYNPGGPGGYGIVYVNTDTGETLEHSAGYVCTTNNRMEILAVINALDLARKICPNEPFEIITDSQYVINVACGAWRRNKNTDLWEQYDKAAKDLSFGFHWVPGHSGNPYNERCDQLASLAMCGIDLQTDTGYLAEKAAGNEFYRAVEKKMLDGTIGGAMAVNIHVPEDLDQPPDICHSRTYAEKYHVRDSCAKAIMRFYSLPGHKFKDYIALKTGGMDIWSRKKKAELIDKTGQEALDIVTQYFPDEKNQLSCLRWFCRGLKLSDSIRKVFVDQEVSENCRY